MSFDIEAAEKCAQILTDARFSLNSDLPLRKAMTSWLRSGGHPDKGGVDGLAQSVKGCIDFMVDNPHFHIYVKEKAGILASGQHRGVWAKTATDVFNRVLGGGKWVGTFFMAHLFNHMMAYIAAILCQWLLVITIRSIYQLGGIPPWVEKRLFGGPQIQPQPYDRLTSGRRRISRARTRSRSRATTAQKRLLSKPSNQKTMLAMSQKLIHRLEKDTSRVL